MAESVNDALDQCSQEGTDSEVKNSQKKQKYYKCCAKKAYTSFICKNCGAPFHDSCARRLIEKKGLSFMDEVYVKCCEKPASEMDNELSENINIQLKEENIKMRYENLLLQKEIEHLKYVLVESQKNKELLFNEMSDKNIILRKNKKLLAERITQLQNRPIEKIMETKPEKSNQNKVDIPLSLPSTLKPAYSSMVKNVTESGPSSRNTQTTTNNKQNLKIELQSNQKLTPTKTITNQEVKKIQGNQQHNQTTSKQKRETTLLYIKDEISESKEEQQSPKVKIQQERENWREVVKKRNPKQTRPVPIKGAMDKFSLTIAEQQSCLFLSGLDPDIGPEEVKEYIDTTFKISSKCEKMKTKKDRFKSSFKVYVPTDSKQQVLNENMWGKGIVINHFLHIRRNFNREVNPVTA
ncbi:hypothetical protein HHI36_014784 [Cryptolaemus montrouzieri]|uniref:Uncharacterized protein n=1 Tax=Cryptolaemus montrouzieri TaxID=559131 RepID=A0ABD2N4M5_9CUCU